VTGDGNLEIRGFVDFHHSQNLQYVEGSCKYEEIIDMGEGIS
jgi:hypothetical protein